MGKNGFPLAVFPWRLGALALTPLFLVFTGVGCGPSTGTFNIAVRNETAGPITIGLAKTGGPPEALWASPEDLAMTTGAGGTGRGAEKVWGPVVPPGKTATLPQITGKFDKGSDAVLRVYAGTPDLSHMLAMSRGSHDRLDLGLDNGKNFFLIRQDPHGALSALRLAGPPPEGQTIGTGGKP